MKQTKRQQPAWVSRKDEATREGPMVKCIYPGRVVVSSAPSSMRYDFEPGQVKEVAWKDLAYLLALKKTQSDTSCCGGTRQGSIAYFTEV